MKQGYTHWRFFPYKISDSCILTKEGLQLNTPFSMYLQLQRMLWKKA